MSVRGNHGRLFAIALEKDTGKMRPSLILRDRKNRLGDHLAEERGLDLASRNLVHAWQLRIVPVAHADDFELGSATFDLQPILFVTLQVHLVAPQALDDFIELASDNRNTALLDDLGGGVSDHGNLQVGRSYHHLVLANRPQEHVGQDRDGVLPIRNSVGQVEATQQLILSNPKVHPLPPSSWGFHPSTAL